jgi:hypothetical protein
MDTNDNFLGELNDTCICFKIPLYYKDFDIEKFGTDNNYYDAQITLETCKHCGRKWLNYLVEWEWYTRAGRWYRGIISDGDLKAITPDRVKRYLEQLDWYIRGGSFYDSYGIYARGGIF